MNVSEDICDVCGYPLEWGNLCSRCNESRPKILRMRSLYQYDGQIREALHHLKYDNDLGIAEILGKKCAEYISNNQWEIDLVIPVPLGKERRKERGYNQAAMIAYPLSIYCNIFYNSKCLSRQKETTTQVEFSADRRRQNVKDAFIAEGKVVKGKNVLVVDDIITTGSTIDECASALINAGAKNVYGLSVARTMLAGKLT